MDPHTARCLQLSTSISMPFNPYRPHRFSDPANRSRFPVTAPMPHMRGMSSSQIPPKAWHTPAPSNSAYQPPYTPVATPHSGFLPQQYRVPAMHMGTSTKPMDLEESYFQKCLTPEDQLINDPWDEALKFPEVGQRFHQSEGLGVNFTLDDDLTPTGLRGTTATGFENFAMPQADESWASYPESPDRRSWSSLSTSSGEGFSDFSEVPNVSEMPCLNSELSSGLGVTLSMEETMPALPQRGSRRPNGRLVAQSASCHGYRSAPYSLDRTRSRSTSIASHSVPRTRCTSPLNFASDEFSFQEPTPPSGSSGIMSNNVDMGDFDAYFDERPFIPQHYPYAHDSAFLPTPFEESLRYNGASSVLASSAEFTLPHTTSAIEHRCESHYADFAEAPDLFGPLHGDQLEPPPEDMHPEDSDLTPRKQELRFEGDLYTPKYVRGHGNKREGWCGICKPGRWLVLKNSAFWYDKSFSHGVSAATGTAFDGPKETRRMSGNPDVWEGLCGSCGDWIALISSKKKGTTWFRHAYKCHTHQKVKDTPKRRREANHNRVFKATRTPKAEQGAKDESPEPLGSTILESINEQQLPMRTVSALQTITAMI